MVIQTVLLMSMVLMAPLTFAFQKGGDFNFAINTHPNGHTGRLQIGVPNHKYFLGIDDWWLDLSRAIKD